MKLRNKKTGEIGYFCFANLDKVLIIMNNNGVQLSKYISLAELNEEWEDYEEPKHSYYLTGWGEVKEYPEEGFNINRKLEIGNYFSSREEAELALRKLKAWKRLKDKKIFIWLDHFDYRSQDGSFNVEFGDNLSSDELNQVNDDLDLLFGGEE